MLASLDAQRPRMAAIMGALCAISLAIGFETAPEIVWAGGLIALRFALSKDNAPAAQAFGISLAAVTSAAFLIQTPPSWWLRTGCDALALNSLAGAIVRSSRSPRSRIALRNGDLSASLAPAPPACWASSRWWRCIHPACTAPMRHGPAHQRGLAQPRQRSAQLCAGDHRPTVDGDHDRGDPAGGLCLSVARLRKEFDAGLLGLTALLALTCLVGFVQIRGVALATATAIPLVAPG